MNKISAKKMAKKVSSLLKSQNPNYDYLQDVFRFVREDLKIEVTTKPKRLPYVPTEEEIRLFCKVIWESNDIISMLVVKVLIYTGVRVSELVNITLNDIDLSACQIKINQGKGKKDRIVPFAPAFKETMALHIKQYRSENRKYLFESRYRRHYTDRGIRKILMRYTKLAGMERSISPHKLRHFLFTWLKKQNIDDALIQPYSGHDKRESLEVYSKLSLSDAQKKYNDVIGDFPI